MRVTSYRLFVIAAITTSKAASNNAFVPSHSSRCTEYRHPWSRATISSDKVTSTSKGIKKAADDGGGTASKGFWDRLESIMFAPLEIKTEHSEDGDVDNPRLILAEWNNIWEDEKEICEEIDEFGNRNVAATAAVTVESLTTFLEVWAQITLQNDKGLTTPVSSSKFKTSTHRSTSLSADEGLSPYGKDDDYGDDNCNAGDDYQSSSSMKLIFRPPKRYLSYREQKSMEKGVVPDRKGAKVDAWSPGGVEIQVTIRTVVEAVLETQTSRKRQKTIIGVMAQRCNIDGDTVIKKTSERAIIRRLENALRVWGKTQRQ